MKTYYVIWTYAANYSKLTEIKATGPREAIEKSCYFNVYNPEFQKNGKVYVFDAPPVFITGNG